MKNFIDKMYKQMDNNFTRWDYGLLKTYGGIFGLLIGAYFPDFVKDNQVIFGSIFFILLVRYCYLLFVKTNKVEVSPG